ncbi:unnamed protein product [Brachionus calyciflorus]|uniref:Uncharacterized protein n=1 Tax=Brachionus calyciflorus TaxID=104777 RepID=A0A814ENL3_9BILA|nr:unnamed protein product [Brachionus calyciflorus]
MNSFLKVLVRRNVQAFSIVCQRSVFDDRFLKLDIFKQEREKTRQKYSNTKESVEKAVSYQLSKSVTNVNLSNIRKLIRLASTPNDVYFIIKTLKKIIPTSVLSPNEIRGLVLQVIRLVYILDHIDIAISFYDDADFAPYVIGGYGSLLIMNKLLINKEYERLIDLFDRQLDKYSSDISFSINSNENFRQTIPFDQLDCVSEALLNMVNIDILEVLSRRKNQTNSKESMEKLKFLLKILDEKNSNLGRRSVARLFLLSINQNEPIIALNLVHKFTFSIDLRLNLEIIALCNLGKLSNAFILADEMFNLISVPSDKYTGKFLPLVVSS